MLSGDKNELIVPPVADIKRRFWRTATESAVGLIPGGQALAEFYKISHPPKSERDHEAWEWAVSERSNEHDGLLKKHQRLLRPRETISGLPAQIIEKLIKECPDGLGLRIFNVEHIREVFSNSSDDEIEEAIEELGSIGLLNIRRYMTGWHASLTVEAYEMLDGQIMGFNTLADATDVAQLMLDLKTGSARELNEATGWPRRRFNPALQFLLRFFPEGRISQEIQADYPTTGVAIVAEDRAKLRKFIQSRDRGAA